MRHVLKESWAGYHWLNDGSGFNLRDSEERRQGRCGGRASSWQVAEQVGPQSLSCARGQLCCQEMTERSCPASETLSSPAIPSAAAFQHSSEPALSSYWPLPALPFGRCACLLDPSCDSGARSQSCSTCGSFTPWCPFRKADLLVEASNSRSNDHCPQQENDGLLYWLRSLLRISYFSS